MKRFRRLPLKGLYNCRDLGGFPTADGHVTRFGVFLRSEAPCELPQEDLDFLRNYGVTASIDLRSSGEQDARPNELKSFADYYPRSLLHKAAVFGDKSHAKAEFNWGDEYVRMADDNPDFFCEMLPVCANEPGVLLYHCTTGKDRTGLLTCVLLSIAGVSKEDIAADYCVSELYLSPVYERMKAGTLNLGHRPADDNRKAPLPDGGSDRFFHTPASAMLQLIDALEKKHGSVVGFVRDCGVPEEVICALHDKLVE